MNELISVIVPIYNVEKYLDKCINSIVNQTYKNIEIIMVDDGSTDNCSLMCDEWAKKDNRIKIIHKKNGGVSSARNIGLDNSSGKYIMFVDSDDFIENQTVEFLYKNISEKETDISICNLCTQNSDGTTKVSSLGEKVILKDKVVESFFDNQAIKDLFYGPYNKLFLKSVIANVKFSDLSMGEDILFIFEVLQNTKKISSVNFNGYIYQYRADSAMHSSFSKKRLDYITAGIRIEEICENKYSKQVQIKAHDWLFYHVLITYRSLLINRKHGEYKEYYEQYKTFLKSNKSSLKSLNFKRKLDYLFTLYFPFLYKLKK